MTEDRASTTYTFKTALLAPPCRASLSPENLQIFKLVDDEWQATQTIPLDTITRIRVYRETHAVDEQAHEFNLQHMSVMSTARDVIHLSSAFVTGNHGRFLARACNQADAYRAFVDLLLERAAAANSDIRLQQGWLLASLAWMIVTLVGAALFALGVALVAHEPDPWGALPAIVFCFLCGGALTVAAAMITLDYFPNSTTLTEYLSAPS